MDVHELDLKPEVDLTPLERDVRNIATLLQTKVKGERVGIFIQDTFLDEERQRVVMTIKTPASYTTIAKRFLRAGAVILRMDYVAHEHNCWQVFFYSAAVSELANTVPHTARQV